MSIDNTVLVLRWAAHRSAGDPVYHRQSPNDPNRSLCNSKQPDDGWLQMSQSLAEERRRLCKMCRAKEDNQ